jgi:hypothetical protein
MRAASRPKVFAIKLNFLPGRTAPGYPLQVLAQSTPERVRGSSGLWAFRFYPCPESVPPPQG